MTDEFVSRFGVLELGPEGGPRYGKSLYARTDGGLAERYRLDESSGWALDVRTDEKAFRVGPKGQMTLPDGRSVPGVIHDGSVKRDDTAQRVFQKPATRHGGPFAGFNTPTPKQPPTIASRMFGTERKKATP